MRDVDQGLFVHYTAEPSTPTEGRQAEKARLRSIQAFHMDVKGWLDIAYSWAVGESGTIYELRGWGVAGGHTQGYNHHSHAVLWIGGTDKAPSELALDGMAIVADEAKRLYGGPVRCHRDVNKTSCPGDALCDAVHRGLNHPSPPSRGLAMATNIVLSNADGRGEEFLLDSGVLRQRWQNNPNGGWSAWVEFSPSPGGALEEIAGFRNEDGRLELIGRNRSFGYAGRTWQSAPGTVWVNWTRTD